MFFVSKNSREQVEVSTHGQGLYIESSDAVIYGNILSGQFKMNTVTQLTFISAASRTSVARCYIIW